MSFLTMRDYYETLKDSYILECKEKRSTDFKIGLGFKLNALLTILFILTFSQIIPLSILNALPERYRSIPFYKIDIPTIIVVNVVILLILKLFHHLNRENLVYARISDKKKQKRIGSLQKSFSAIFTCLIKLRAYSETNDESQVKEAGEHYHIFTFMLPYQMFIVQYEDQLLPDINSILSKDYIENYLPWFNLTAEEIGDIESVRYFLQQSGRRISNKQGINDIMPSLEALSLVYYSALKDRDHIRQHFLEFRENVKTIPNFVMNTNLAQDKIEETIKEYFLKIEQNYLLYFSMVFVGYLLAAFLLIYWPSRSFFNVSTQTLAPVVFATALTLAFMDTEKNVKTDLKRKEPKEPKEK